MGATAKLLLTLLVIGFELNEVFSRDFKWFFEPMKCRPNYTEGVYETWEEAENTADDLNGYGEKAIRDRLNQNCSHLADDDVCMIECIFKALYVFIEHERDISFYMSGLWENIYHHTKVDGVEISRHVENQCRNHIPEKLDCKDSRDLLDCVMNYMNCSKTIEDPAPYHYFPGACHKLFGRKADWYYAEETKDQDRVCHRAFKDDFVCEKACILNGMLLTDALGHALASEANNGGNPDDGIFQNFADKLLRFGMGDPNIPEADRHKANYKMVQELVAACKHLYKPFMSIYHKMYAPHFSQLRCSENRSDWEALIECTENYFGCKY